MLAAVRRLTKSKAGPIVMGLFLLAIALSFALQDVSGTMSTFGGSGMSEQTLAEAGSEELTEREFSGELQRRLEQVRQSNPEADYGAIAGDFDPLLDALIQQEALAAFAAGHDLVVSKRLVDAELARLPQTRGLDGRFSPEAYARLLQTMRMTDSEFREQIARVLRNRMILAPVSAEARVPVGIARPYAAMQLEVREADIAFVPIAAFMAGIPNPTGAQLSAFYSANRQRYMLPEQRVLNIARIDPGAVAGVTATDKEIADFYRANQATYGARSQRVISQAVVPAKAAADALAAKLRSGTSFVDAARPLGFSAADISVGPQTREQFAALTNPQVATAVFTGNVRDGSVVGPLRSDLGWHVIKVDRLIDQPAKPLAAVRGEILDKLNADKRKGALAELIANLEDDIAQGMSFSEAVAKARLAATRTPPITAGGKSLTDPSYAFDPQLAPALRTGFDLGQGEDPMVETLPGDAGYALVGVEQVIPAAPAPLARIRDQVEADWKSRQANERARAAATRIATLAAKGTLANAVAGANAGVALPPPQSQKIQRIQLVQMGGNVPPALAMMFSLAEGRSRMVVNPEGRGFAIVKVKKITPGDATLQPGLVAQIQRELQEPIANELAEQFVRAVAKDVGVERNEKAIRAARQRILGGG
jgi:peptidyl-prolyl cis-trans isomerase D